MGLNQHLNTCGAQASEVSLIKTMAGNQFNGIINIVDSQSTGFQVALRKDLFYGQR